MTLSIYTFHIFYNMYFYNQKKQSKYLLIVIIIYIGLYIYMYIYMRVCVCVRQSLWPNLCVGCYLADHEWLRNWSIITIFKGIKLVLNLTYKICWDHSVPTNLKPYCY